MKRTKISIFVHDLSENPIVRVGSLFSGLSHDFDVEVLGFLIGSDQVFPPYQDHFPYKVVKCRNSILDVCKAMPALARQASGEVIFAFKPLLTSFGPALLASGFGRQKPLFLDVDDDEWATSSKNRADFFYRYVLKGWRHPTAHKFTLLLHILTHLARQKTVVSRKLQRRYGGLIVRQSANEMLFVPERYSKNEIEAAKGSFGLPINGRLLALFAGMPRPHKGWDTLLQALTRPECDGWDLVLAGDPNYDDFERAAEILGTRCHRVGSVPQARMADLVACADALPVPQKRLTFTESQVPAKMLEGMAMAKPIIATTVGDLPEILGNGERGWLIEPDDVVGLARAFAEIATDPSAAKLRGRAARDWFMQEASSQAIREKLVPLITKAAIENKK